MHMPTAKSISLISRHWRGLIIIFLPIISCTTNPYMKFYKGLEDPTKLPAYDPIQDELKIFTTTNFDQDMLALLRKGYSVIGQAFFNAPSSKVTEYQLKEQAAKIGAHVALVSTQYTHTISGAMPLTLPNATRSSTTGSATIFTPNGTVGLYPKIATHS